MDPKERLINELHCLCLMPIYKETFIENSSKQLKPILMGPEQWIETKKWEIICAKKL